MIWLLCLNGRTIARGSYEQVIDRADRAGLLFHIVMVDTPDGGVRPSHRRGRHFTRDGVELPCRLEKGCAIVLDGMTRLARRVA